MKNKIIMILIIILMLCSSCNGTNLTDKLESSSNQISSIESSALPEENNISNINNNIKSEYIDEVYENKIKKITTGCATISAILDDGTLVMWGSNTFGTIGNGNMGGDGALFGEPPFLHDFGEKVVDTGSVLSSYALTESGALYVWGTNDRNEIGVEGSPVNMPYKVKNVNNIKQVTMSTDFSLLLDNDNTVYHAGVKIEQFENTDDYILGLKKLGTKIDATYKKLDLDFSCKKIYSSALAYVFLSDNGEVYIQGLIDGDYEQKLTDFHFPVPAKLDFPEKISDVAALATNIVAVSESGNVYIFGNPNSAISSETTDIKISENMYQKKLYNIKSVSGNSDFVVAALNDAGDIYAWGVDNYGSIKTSNLSFDGVQSMDFISEPIKLDMHNITQFSFGDYNGAAIDKSGHVYIWGSNRVKQFIEFK